MNYKIRFTLLAICCISFSRARLPAFPGAEGFGVTASGGREKTNKLNPANVKGGLAIKGSTGYTCLEVYLNSLVN